MKGANIIFKKEMKRIFQDKKMIFSLFILPAIIIIGMYSLIGVMMNRMVDDIKKHESIVYIQNMPKEYESLLKTSGFLEVAKVTYLTKESSVKEYENKILKESIDLLVSFENNFNNSVASYEKSGDVIPKVTLFYNTTGKYSTEAESNFRTLVLEPLQQQLLAKRLGNLEVLQVFQIAEKVIVDADKQNGQFLAMLLPYMITFMLFVGAMSLGVDAITGEKERQTMAKLLLTPINRSEIVLGKLSSLAVLSSISAVVYAISMIIAMPMMEGNMGSQGGAISVRFGVTQVVALFITMIVMVYLYVGLVALVSVFAKTAKEASSYISPLYIVIIVAGMLTMFQGGIEKPLYHYAIPVYGNSLAIQNIMTNELTLAQFLISSCSTLILAILVTIAIAKAFNNEKIMFNA
ncbi:ABC transporter permease [Lachnoclostridium phytofermentans]|uniref:ABC-2 type transporter n=1 Tax=Lachnoclostridium phytofermentans (strain ATCC 700394 / DSM 18823 / ISDg) TaxID=357809 RepID=A9KR36_LACP7|nr:ABC transporter permease [Lachnoclostridium phytofermentans]ABX40504.1 ABC-2 type transporter [Lachnoclostridium phytofermentans ISDg]